MRSRFCWVQSTAGNLDIDNAVSVSLGRAVGSNTWTLKAEKRVAAVSTTVYSNARRLCSRSTACKIYRNGTTFAFLWVRRRRIQGAGIYDGCARARPDGVWWLCHRWTLAGLWAGLRAPARWRLSHRLVTRRADHMARATNGGDVRCLKHPQAAIIDRLISPVEAW